MCVQTNTASDQDLWVKFTMHGIIYCLESRFVSSMEAMGEIFDCPDRASWQLGLTRTAGGSLMPAVDLRALLQLPSLQSDFNTFIQMKEKHTFWVDELIRSVREDIPFTLNLDPHQCSFGLWYDKYHPDNKTIADILVEIGEPHERMHRCARLIDEARAAGNEARVEEILDLADTLCHGKIVPLLDKLITAYQEAHRGIIMVLNSPDNAWAHFALVVDNVIGLESFAIKKGVEALASFGASQFIKDINLSAGHEICLEIDGKKLLDLMG